MSAPGGGGGFDSAPRRIQPNLNAARPANANANWMSMHAAIGGGINGPAAGRLPDRPNPPPAIAPMARGGSLPPQPNWIQRAYHEPNSSPLVTQLRQPPMSAPVQPIKPIVRVPATSGVSWTSGSAAAAARSGTNLIRPSPSPAPSRSAPKPVAFPPGFNPNAAPPPFTPPVGATNYRGPPASSATRVAFYAPDSDVPKGRRAPRSAGDLGAGLPAHLQKYVNTPRGKLPDSLTEGERKLLRAERRKLKQHDKSSAKELATMKKEKERIDLDVFHQEQSRERGGWNDLRIKVAFQLCSDDRIAVDSTPRNHLLVMHVLQSLEGAKFDKTLSSIQPTGRGHKLHADDEGGRKGLWTIPVSTYDACIARCIGLRTDSRDIVIVPVDMKHLNAIRGASSKINKIQMKFESMQGIPAELARNLYPFQKEGVEYCVAHNGRAMIGDEMGLGKSIQSLAVAAYYQDDWPLLVVCPSSVRLTWRNELLKWLGVSSLRESDITAISSSDDEDEEDDLADIADSDGEEAEYAMKPIDKYQDDFVEDDDEFERILQATANSTSTDLPKRATPAAKPLTMEEKAEAFLNQHQSNVDDGEAEYDLAPVRSKSKSRRSTVKKPVARKRKRRSGYSDDDSESYSEESDDDDDDEYSNGSQPDTPSEDEEWSAEAERADRKKAKKVIEDEGEEEEEEEYHAPIKKKTAKRRRIISDDDDDDEDDDGIAVDSSLGVASSDAASPSIKSESISTPHKSTAAPVAASSSCAASVTQPLSAKEQFKAQMAATLAGVKPQALGAKFEPHVKVKHEPIITPVSGDSSTPPDADLEDALRRVAEFEASERLQLRLQQSITPSPEATQVKHEPTVKSESNARTDIVDLRDDTPTPTPTANVKSEEPDLTAAPEAEPPVWVSASSLIKSAVTEDDHHFEVKKQEYAPPKPAPPAIKPKPIAATPSSATSTARPSPTISMTSSSSSSPDPPAFQPPVKPYQRPAFKPLFKNEINVILSGKDTLLPGGVVKTRVVIISYDLLIKYTLQLQREKFRFIIADESHMVKNATAKRSQVLLPLLEQSKRVLCLSGTPAMSRPFELYPQINALCPGVFGSAHQFGARYCAPTKGFRGVIEYKGANNLVELHMLLKKYCLVRRLKMEVLKDLRPKTRTVIMTSVHDRGLSETIKRIANIKQIVTSEMDAQGKQTNKNDSSSVQIAPGSKLALMECFAKTGILKLPFILSYIADLIENGTKFLIFAHHLNVLNGIEEFLRKEKTGYFRLDGSTSAVDRQAGVERFQSEPACQVALLSITAGGTGITLTAASTVVFAELQWTPALLRQAEDRVHRIGQCWAPGTRLMQFDGTSVNVEDILVGAQLMGDDGTPRTVQKLFHGNTGQDAERATPDQRRPAMYRITPSTSGMASWSCNGSHVLVLRWTQPPSAIQLTHDVNRPYCFTAFERLGDSVVEAQHMFASHADAARAHALAMAKFVPLEAELTVDGFLNCTPSVRESAAMFHTSTPLQFKQTSASLKERLEQQMDVDVSHALVLDTAWVLGLYATSGSGDQIALPNDDHSAPIRNMLIAWCNMVSVTRDFATDDVVPAAGESVYVHGGDVLRHLVESYDLSNASGILPRAMLQESVAIRSAFASGILAAHGELNESDDCITFTHASESHLQTLCHLMRGLGCNVSPIQTEAESGAKTIQVNNCASITATHHRRVLHQSVDVKSSTLAGYCFGFHVSAVADGDYYGFELDGNRRCLLDDFTVTHNSSAVNIYYILANHTIDDILWPMLSAKLEVLGSALDGREDNLAVRDVAGEDAARKNTNLRFKYEHVDVDLTKQEEEKKSTQTVHAQAKTEPPKPIGRNNWIGMSNQVKKQVNPPTPAPTPFAQPPSLPSSTSSQSVSSLAPRSSSANPFMSVSAIASLRRDVAAPSAQSIEKMQRQLKEEAASELERFQIPLTQSDQRNFDEAEVILDSDDDEEINQTQANMPPPKDAIIALVGESDAEYASDEEKGEEDEEMSGLTVREALIKMKQQQNGV